MPPPDNSISPECGDSSAARYGWAQRTPGELRTLQFVTEPTSKVAASAKGFLNGDCQALWIRGPHRVRVQRASSLDSGR